MPHGSDTPARQLLAHLNAVPVSAAQEPGSPAAGPCNASGGVGNFFRRASRPQSEAEISAVMRKALKGRR